MVGSYYMMICLYFIILVNILVNCKTIQHNIEIPTPVVRYDISSNKILLEEGAEDTPFQKSQATPAPVASDIVLKGPPPGQHIYLPTGAKLLDTTTTHIDNNGHAHIRSSNPLALQPNLAAQAKAIPSILLKALTKKKHKDANWDYNARLPGGGYLCKKNHYCPLTTMHRCCIGGKVCCQYGCKTSKRGHIECEQDLQGKAMKAAAKWATKDARQAIKDKIKHDSELKMAKLFEAEQKSQQLKPKPSQKEATKDNTMHE